MKITCVKVTPTLGPQNRDWVLLKVETDEGIITVPDGPGLGIELDEDVIAEELPEGLPLWS